MERYYLLQICSDYSNLTVQHMRWSRHPNPRPEEDWVDGWWGETKLPRWTTGRVAGVGGGWRGGVGRRGIVITGLWDCLQRTNNNQLFRAWFSAFSAPTDYHPLIHSNIIILAFFHPRSVLSSPLILIMQGRELIFNYLLPSIIHQLFFINMFPNKNINIGV